MIEVALISLEKAINAYCRLDPNTIQRLSSLEGKVIKCHITDWDANFYITPHDQGVRLSQSHYGQTDTSISGTLNGLFRLGCAKGATKAATKNKILISGDTEVAQTLQSIFSEIDIDWETHLAKCMGDTLAHQLGNAARHLFNAGKDATKSLKRSLQEYLHHEARTFPTQQECDTFYQDVSKIKNDVERAHARIKQLQQAKNHE